MRTTERAHQEAVESVWVSLSFRFFFPQLHLASPACTRRQRPHPQGRPLWLMLHDRRMLLHRHASNYQHVLNHHHPTKVSIETGAVVEWHNEQNYVQTHPIPALSSRALLFQQYDIPSPTPLPHCPDPLGAAGGPTHVSPTCEG
jgi:hypothetical protein